MTFKMGQGQWNICYCMEKSIRRVSNIMLWRKTQKKKEANIKLFLLPQEMCWLTDYPGTMCMITVMCINHWQFIPNWIRTSPGNNFQFHLFGAIVVKIKISGGYNYKPVKFQRSHFMVGHGMLFRFKTICSWISQLWEIGAEPWAKLPEDQQLLLPSHGNRSCSYHPWQVPAASIPLKC